MKGRQVYDGNVATSAGLGTSFQAHVVSLHLGIYSLGDTSQVLTMLLGCSRILYVTGLEESLLNRQGDCWDCCSFIVCFFFKIQRLASILKQHLRSCMWKKKVLDVNYGWESNCKLFSTCPVQGPGRWGMFFFGWESEQKQEKVEKDQTAMSSALLPPTGLMHTRVADQPQQFMGLFWCSYSFIFCKIPVKFLLCCNTEHKKRQNPFCHPQQCWISVTDP